MSPLEIDRQARTISGRVIPWNTPALVGRTRVALRKDSLIWPDPTLLLLRHDHSLIVGRAVAGESRNDGLYATFRVRNGAVGDQALVLDEVDWDFSCGFDIHESIRGDVLWCLCGEITEVSLVPNPAFPRSVVTSRKKSEEPDEGELVASEESGEDQTVDVVETDEPVASDDLEPAEDEQDVATEELQPPPEFISEANRLQIERDGEAIEAFTGRILTRDDLEAYNQAQLEKQF